MDVPAITIACIDTSKGVRPPDRRSLHIAMAVSCSNHSPWQWTAIEVNPTPGGASGNFRTPHAERASTLLQIFAFLKMGSLARNQTTV
jgi:hypothetical protein